MCVLMNRRATKNNRTMTTTDCSESNLFEFLFLCHAIVVLFIGFALQSCLHPFFTLTNYGRVLFGSM